MRPAYLTRASLAAELEISESTVDAMVRRGVIPKPVHLSSGCVRWRWESVDEALALIQGCEPNTTLSNDDAEGVQRAIEAAKERRGGRSA